MKIGEISLGHVQHRANAALPKLLGVGESATWIVPLESILAAAHAARETGINHERLRGFVSLGSGKTRVTPPALVSTTELPALFGLS